MKTKSTARRATRAKKQDAGTLVLTNTSKHRYTVTVGPRCRDIITRITRKLNMEDGGARTIPEVLEALILTAVQQSKVLRKEELAGLVDLRQVA